MCELFHYCGCGCFILFFHSQLIWSSLCFRDLKFHHKVLCVYLISIFVLSTWPLSIGNYFFLPWYLFLILLTMLSSINIFWVFFKIYLFVLNLLDWFHNLLSLISYSLSSINLYWGAPFSGIFYNFIFQPLH